MPQRRRRVFLIGYYESTETYKNLQKSLKIDWLIFQGTIAKAFPVTNLGSLNVIEFKQ